MKQSTLLLQSATGTFPAWITKFHSSVFCPFDEEAIGTIFIHGEYHPYICDDFAMKVPLWKQTDNLPLLIKLSENKSFQFKHLQALEIASVDILKPNIPIGIAENLYNKGNITRQQTRSINLLFSLINQLNTPLRQFLFDVFSNKAISKAFSTVNASVNHHHAWQGGLLVHSVESALMASQLARTWMTPVEAEVTIVAALLHDIGKTRTFNSGGHWSELGHYVSHDALTLEILAPYLANLDKQWPTGANMIRHILGWNRNDKTFPAFPGTSLLKMCDQFSTALELRDTTFNNKPHWHYRAQHDGIRKQRFLRLNNQ